MLNRIACISFTLNHPANRGRRLAALARLIRWQVDKHLLKRSRVVTLGNGLRVWCHPDSSMASRIVYTGGQCDYAEMEFLKAYLRRGDRFIDVGANIGLYTLLAAGIVGPSGSVDAFEAGALSLERLRENIALNGLSNVRVHAAAVSDTPGTVYFTQGLDSTNHIAKDAGGDVVAVPAVRLDDVLTDPAYAMGKMDIEGAEILAFRGAQRLLAEGNPPIWFIELTAACRSFDTTEAGVAEWLADHGYDLGIFNLEAFDFDFPPQPWTRTGDLFAIDRRRLDDIRARIREARSRT